MSFATICIPCQFGEHGRCQVGHHIKGIIGGWHCTCEGECQDGRYKPAWVGKPAIIEPPEVTERRNESMRQLDEIFGNLKED